MPRPLRIQYPNAPPASPESFAMVGRVVLRHEQGEKGRARARLTIPDRRFGSRHQSENHSSFVSIVNPSLFVNLSANPLILGSSYAKKYLKVRNLPW